MNEHPSVLVLFDGVCNLCNGAVQFIIRRDPHARFRFAALQSQAAQTILKDHGIDPNPAQLYSMMVLDRGVLYQRSDAALRITRYLTGVWPAFSVLTIIPRFIRNGIYNTVATHRYAWFGKQQSCMIPTPDLKQRFLE